MERQLNEGRTDRREGEGRKRRMDGGRERWREGGGWKEKDGLLDRWTVHRTSG